MDVTWFLNIVEEGDVVSILMLLLCLSFIGSRSIHSRPNQAQWSGRIGMATLLAYTVYRGITMGPTTPEELLWILLRGLLAAGFVTTVCWILLPVVVGVWSRTVEKTLHAARAASVASQKRLSEQRAATQRLRELQAAARQQERIGPEWERQQQDAEERTRIERATAETANRRREEARLRSELFYERHARQLAASFPRERFEQFVQRYLSGDTAPELVEQREELLKEMIVDSLGTKGTNPKFASITELSAFYAARREEIDNLPHSDEIKDAYSVELNKQEDESLRRYLKP